MKKQISQLSKNKVNNNVEVINASKPQKIKLFSVPISENIIGQTKKKNN